MVARWASPGRRGSIPLLPGPPCRSSTGGFSYLLVVVQIPIADLRSFVPLEMGRLRLPTWPSPGLGEFVRGFGAIGYRRRGGLNDLGEHHFCNARQLLCLDGAYLRRSGLTVAFRRFYFDGLASGRLEIGFSVENARAQSAKSIGSAIHSAALCTTRIRHSPHLLEHEPLLGAGARISAAYLQSTTQRGISGIESVPQWAAKSCGPCVYVESDVHLNWPERELRVAWSDCLREENFSLANSTVRIGPFSSRLIVGVRNLGGKRQIARHLRLWLLRLHAERQVLSHVLRQLATERLSISNDMVQYYLNRAVGSLNRSRQRLGEIDLAEKAQQSIWSSYENLLDFLKIASEARSSTSELRTPNQKASWLRRQLGRSKGLANRELMNMAIATDAHLSADEISALRLAMDNLSCRKNIKFNLNKYLDEWEPASVSLRTSEGTRTAVFATGHSAIYIGSEHVGDNYHNTGQAGAIGRASHAEKMIFQQAVLPAQQIDLGALARELIELRKAMRDQASDPDHDIAIGKIAAAQQAAESGDSSGAIEHLKAAGKWALDVSTKIGGDVAAAALKVALGL